MPIKVYEYAKCSTCRKALQFLDKNKVPYQKLAIVESPPSEAELRRMLGYVGGELRRLFNTSGELYREMKLSEKLASMTPDEAIRLLARHGKLIKRPFVLGDGKGWVGFNPSVEAEWKKSL